MHVTVEETLCIPCPYETPSQPGHGGHLCAPLFCVWVAVSGQERQSEVFVGTSCENSRMLMVGHFRRCILLWHETEFFHDQGGNCFLLSRQPHPKCTPPISRVKVQGELRLLGGFLNTPRPQRHSSEGVPLLLGGGGGSLKACEIAIKQICPREQLACLSHVGWETG